jgi:hypothetical protein
VVFTFVALIVPSAALAAEIASVVEKKTDSTQPAGDNKGLQLPSNAVSGASRSNATKFCMPSADGDYRTGGVRNSKTNFREPANRQPFDR